MVDPIHRAAFVTDRIDGRGRTSPVVERWFGVREQHPELHAYHPFRAVHDFDVTGPLDPSLLAKSWRALVAHHDILRSAFCRIGDQVIQSLAEPERSREMLIHDLRGTTPQPPALENVLRSLYLGPIHPEKGNSFRVGLISLTDTNHRLVLALDHVGFDGRSRRILLRDLFALYEAMRADPSIAPEAVLGTQRRQYLDWARELWRELDGGYAAALRDRWAQYLDGAPDLILPGHDPSPEPITSAMRYRGELSADLIAAADELMNGLDPARSGARRAELIVDINALPLALLSVVFALLHRSSGQNDLCLAVPVDARPRDYSRAVGHFVIPAILRVQVRSSMTFRDLVRAVADEYVDAQRWRRAPIYCVYAPARGLWRLAFNYQRDIRRPPSEGVSFAPTAVPYPRPSFIDMDLQLLMVESPDRQRISASVSARERSQPETVARLLRDYIALARELFARPGDRIG